MIQFRSVASLTDIVRAAAELRAQYNNVAYTVWKRGRRFTLIIDVDTYSDEGKLQKKQYEARFNMEPVGTSSSRQGYNRWLVYIDDWTGTPRKSTALKTFVSLMLGKD